MNNISAAAAQIWSSLRPVLEREAARITELYPDLIQDIRCTSNDAFLLRAYLAFRKSNFEDELAITIDVVADGDQVTITSDVSMDNGDTVTAGPTKVLDFAGESTVPAPIIEMWMKEFDNFLVEQEAKILSAINELKDDEVARPGSGI